MGDSSLAVVLLPASTDSSNDSCELAVAARRSGVKLDQVSSLLGRHIQLSELPLARQDPVANGVGFSIHSAATLRDKLKVSLERKHTAADHLCVEQV